MRVIEGCWEFYRNAKFGCTTYTRKEPFTSSLNHNNSKMGGTILFGFYECLFKFNFHHFNSSFKYALNKDNFVFLATEKHIAHSKMTSLPRKVAYCLYCRKKKGLWTTAPSTWLPRLPLTFNELILLLLLGTSLLSTCGPTNQSERSLLRSRLLIGREQMAPEGPPGIPGNPGTVSRGCPLVWWRPRWTTSSSEFKTSKPLTNGSHILTISYFQDCLHIVFLIPCPLLSIYN